MLIKTGDAQILDIVNPEKIEDDNTRKDALSAALDRAKWRISANKEEMADKEKDTEN